MSRKRQKKESSADESRENTVPRKHQKKESFADESPEQLILNIKQSFYPYFGNSSNPEAVIKKKFAAQKLDIGPRTCKMIFEMIEEKIKACNTRVAPRLEELAKRFKYIETSP